MPDHTIRHFPYLEHLDERINHYAQFGADKCCVTNFPVWCAELDVYEHLTKFITENSITFIVVIGN